MKIQQIDNIIILPWDYSDFSHHALEKACSMVDPSQIHVVHVTEHPTAYEYGIVWDSINESVREERLTEAFREATKDNPVYEGIKFTVLFGNPGDRISQYAEENSADMILMASHGRRGVSRFLLGSVAERILRAATCPVLVLREKPDAAGTKEDSAMAKASS